MKLQLLNLYDKTELPFIIKSNETKSFKDFSIGDCFKHLVVVLLINYYRKVGLGFIIFCKMTILRHQSRIGAGKIVVNFTCELRAITEALVMHFFMPDSNKTKDQEMLCDSQAVLEAVQQGVLAYQKYSPNLRNIHCMG